MIINLAIGPASPDHYPSSRARRRRLWADGAIHRYASSGFSASPTLVMTPGV